MWLLATVTVQCVQRLAYGARQWHPHQRRIQQEAQFSRIGGWGAHGAIGNIDTPQARATGVHISCIPPARTGVRLRKERGNPLLPHQSLNLFAVQLETAIL